MAYTALYRKYRPATFDEIIGQEHITTTIKNQIVSGRVGHAYLFNGGRGTGKTSAAKILARAINCLNPKDGEPCNECEICKAALSGNLTDIVEMDAASNNGVDDIRQIREEVNFLPTKAKYRVYIIDEVHMLSSGAFNALLKTLEEPPAHVKFILATTEPQKLPATVLSRCQRFDFKKISNENISKRLQYICDESKIEINKSALNLISVLSEGAMRDALSILERCIQDGDTKIDENKVKELIGIPKLTYINRLADSIINSNVDNALKVIDEIVEDGKDIQNFLWELIKYTKDILMFKGNKVLEIYSKEELEDIEKLSNNITKERLLSVIYALSNLENDIKWSSQRLIMFQVGIIKLCNNDFDKQDSNSGGNNSDIERLSNKISQLEQKISQIGVNVINKPTQNVDNNTNKIQNTANIPNTTTTPNNEVKTNKVNNVNTSKSTTSDLKGWDKIVNEFKETGKIMLYTNLLNSTANEINDMTIGIEFPKGLTPFGKAILEKIENVNEIEKKVSIEYGKPMRIKYIDKKNDLPKQQSQNVNPLEGFAQDMDLPFNVIDE